MALLRFLVNLLQWRAMQWCDEVKVWWDFCITAGRHRHSAAPPSTWVAFYSGREHTAILKESNEGEVTPPPPLLLLLSLESPASQRSTAWARRTGLKVCCVHVGALKEVRRADGTDFSPWKNQRDEEQRQPGTMRSRLPRTACLLRLIALCILLSHTAAYFGSDIVLEFASSHHAAAFALASLRTRQLRTDYWAALSWSCSKPLEFCKLCDFVAISREGHMMWFDSTTLGWIVLVILTHSFWIIL